MADRRFGMPQGMRKEIISATIEDREIRWPNQFESLKAQAYELHGRVLSDGILTIAVTKFESPEPLHAPDWFTIHLHAAFNDGGTVTKAKYKISIKENRLGQEIKTLLDMPEDDLLEILF